MAQNHSVWSECLDCTANLLLGFEVPVMHERAHARPGHDWQMDGCKSLEMLQMQTVEKAHQHQLSN